jgi:peptidoglycan/xylan/chitin deacetylase (PgdA/CDA1 family)
MKYISEKFDLITIDEMLAAQPDPGDKTKIVVTFDDANYDFYCNVYPVLARLQIPVTLFVPVHRIDLASKAKSRTTEWHRAEKSACNWTEIRALSRDPLVNVGSHSLRHLSFRGLQKEEGERELAESKKVLEDQTGGCVYDFAWPYGDDDDRFIETALGLYRSIFLFRGGGIRDLPVVPSAIPRVSVRESDKVFWFKRKCHGKLDLEDNIRTFLKKLT